MLAILIMALYTHYDLMLSVSASHHLHAGSFNDAILQDHYNVAIC